MDKTNEERKSRWQRGTVLVHIDSAQPLVWFFLLDFIGFEPDGENWKYADSIGTYLASGYFGYNDYQSQHAPAAKPNPEKQRQNKQLFTGPHWGKFDELNFVTKLDLLMRTDDLRAAFEELEKEK